MAKQKFDDVLLSNIRKNDSELQTKQARKEFLEFVDEEIPREVNAYEWLGNEVLIKVFKFVPNSEEGVALTFDSASEELRNTRYISICKVLASGPDSKYKPGSIVKLKDIDTLTIESSKYKDWVNNEFSKSNLKQKGEEPQRFVCNIFNQLGKYAFILNPLDITAVDSEQDTSIYKLYDNMLENPIKDVSILLN